MGIDHGDTHVRMPEQFLHGADVVTALQQVSGEGMAQHVRAHGLGQPGATLTVYEGAHHGWDGDYMGLWFHPALGRSYYMAPNQAVTERSRRDVLSFLQRVMK